MTAGTEIFIDLLRHGEAEGGARYRGSRDDPLTARGWTQLQNAVGDARQWKSIASSPLRRCLDFSRQLAQRLSLPLHVDERLREMHFGAWEGKTAAELLAADAAPLADFWNDPAAHTPPDGEAWTSVQARVLAAWEELACRPVAGNILIVTHGGPIRIILCHLLGMSTRAMLRLEVPHAGLSRVRMQFDREGRRFTSLVFHAGRL